MKKDKIIDLWSKLVKLRAFNKCELCGKTDYLNAHHFVSRSNSATRYDPFNGIALCSGCHTLNNHSAHKDPFFKDNLIEKKIRSKDFFKQLRVKSNQIVKRNQAKIIWKPILEREIENILNRKNGNI